MIWLWFLLAFALGFILSWFSMIDDKDTGFVIFESDEELQKGCWEGLRKGLE